MKIFEFTFVCSFMGLSETLPVTSYFKMIDIWMLFTMTVPFLEVVLHTAKEVFKKSKPAHACLSKQVDMVKFKPAEDDQEATFHSSSNPDRIFYPKQFRIGNSIRQGFFFRKPRRIGFFIQNCFG